MTACGRGRGWLPASPGCEGPGNIGLGYRPQASAIVTTNESPHGEPAPTPKPKAKRPLPAIPRPPDRAKRKGRDAREAETC